MKILKITFLLVFALIINSCSIDNKQEATPSLYGTWNLVQVSGGSEESTYTFGRGLIVWGFDLETIIVNNNNTNDDLLDGFSSGTYNYVLDKEPAEETNCFETISFSETNVNCIDYDTKTMIISSKGQNGLTYFFSR